MKIDDSNREYSESEVRSYIKGLNARIANAETIHAEAQRIAEGVIDELKKENAELHEANEEFAEAYEDLKPLKKENKELKEMLKTALTAINSLCYCGSDNCNYCKYDYDVNGCNNSNGFKWVHGDEAKKLIGDEHESKI